MALLVLLSGVPLHRDVPTAFLGDVLKAAQAARVSYMPTTSLVILPHELTPLCCCKVCLKSQGSGAQHAEGVTLAYSQ